MSYEMPGNISIILCNNLAEQIDMFAVENINAVLSFKFVHLCLISTFRMLQMHYVLYITV